MVSNSPAIASASGSSWVENDKIREALLPGTGREC